MTNFKTTVPAQLNSLKAPTTTMTFLAGGEAEQIPYAQFLDEARAVAARIGARGIGPGDRVAILSPTSRALATTIAGTWLSGAAVIVLPLPMRLGSIEAFIEATRHRIRAADLALLLVSDDLAPYVELEEGDSEPVPLSSILEGDAPEYVEPDVSPDDIAILQFTSGSTGSPRGVTVTQGALLANLAGVIKACRITSADSIMSWLPLYHDMGLIGTFAVTLFMPIDLILGAPQDFLSRPRDWLRAMSDYHVTGCAAPNSAYSLAAKMLSRSDNDFDLSAWRVALNGAEPIDPDTVEAFVKAGAPSGLKATTPYPAYGLAEATIAVTFPEPEIGMVVDELDRETLETKGLAVPGSDLRLVRLGKPVDSIILRIVDTDGNEVPERVVGEIQLSGPAVTKGYFRDPEATAEAFEGEWFRTGDLGYLNEGELVVCGRLKDIIIVGGRNCYPQDIERVAEKVEGVRPGNVVAFGVEGARGRETIVVAAETKLPAEETPAVAKEVASKVREWVGIPVHDVVLIVPGTLPKTSSGKVQRSLTKDRYMAGELAVITSTFASA